VTTLDWIIVVVALFAAIQGLLRGFLVGVLTLIGFAAGALAGSRLAEALARGGAASPWSPAFALAGAVAVGGIVAVLFELLGVRARRGVHSRVLAGVDALFGAVLGAAVALAIVWIAGAVALQTPGLGTLRADVQRSAVLRTLNSILPPSGPVLRALARFDPLPAIAGPSTTSIEPPDQSVLRRPGVQLAAAGTVRILGTACGLGVEGSGWIAAPGVVVTNAHVVAGTDGDVVVESQGEGADLPARAIAFDATDDLAVLAVPGLQGRVLQAITRAPEGTAGAILGYPQDGPFDARAARIGATQTVITQDAYGRGPVRRTITSVRGLLRHGNSGGPVVDGTGRVLATVFAASTTSRSHGGYAVPNSVLQQLLGGIPRSAPTVSTGPCAA